jgi:hypothetical protein
MANLTALNMADSKYNDISDKVHFSFPNSCILWIDRISNTILEEQHETLFENIKKNRPDIVVDKKELFHGTTELVSKIICEDGFETSFNKTSAYGKGTYFAKDAKYSFEYSSRGSKDDIVYMLLCSVIVGKSVCGSHNMEIDKLEADNSVDRIIDPKIFVTPYDKGGIPKYLIAFNKSV